MATSYLTASNLFWLLAENTNGYLKIKIAIGQ